MDNTENNNQLENIMRERKPEDEPPLKKGSLKYA